MKKLIVIFISFLFLFGCGEKELEPDCKYLLNGDTILYNGIIGNTILYQHIVNGTPEDTIYTCIDSIFMNQQISKLSN